MEIKRRLGLYPHSIPLILLVVLVVRISPGPIVLAHSNGNTRDHSGHTLDLLVHFSLEIQLWVCFFVHFLSVFFSLLKFWTFSSPNLIYCIQLSIVVIFFLFWNVINNHSIWAIYFVSTLCMTLHLSPKDTQLIAKTHTYHKVRTPCIPSHSRLLQSCKHPMHRQTIPTSSPSCRGSSEVVKRGFRIQCSS